MRSSLSSQEPIEITYNWRANRLLTPMKLIRRAVLFKIWPSIRPVFMTKLQKAQQYVGAWSDAEAIGAAQLELLRSAGCSPDSHVLEIGCGCLIAGLPIMTYLKPDRYVGIEPNQWLIDAVVNGNKSAAATIREKRPIFLNNTDFDGSPSGRMFDFVISHSILSHAAYWQYPLFLKSIRKCLSPDGIVLCSIRLFDDGGNLRGDSNDPEWVYPGVSFFSWETIQRVATEEGFDVQCRKDYQELFVSRYPRHIHDWLRLTRTKTRPATA